MSAPDLSAYPSQIFEQSCIGNIAGITVLSFTEGTSLQGYNMSGMTTVTQLSLPHLYDLDPTEAYSGGLVATGMTTLESVSAPNLSHIGGNLDLSTNVELISLTLTALADVGGKIDLHGDTELVDLNLPALVTVDNASGIDAHGCTALTTLEVPVLVPVNGQTLNFNACALNVASVNALLARAVAAAGYVTGTINVAGGTNAAPAGQGATDVTTLTGRGCTVDHN